jgi:hypothetical protein
VASGVDVVLGFAVTVVVVVTVGALAGVVAGGVVAVLVLSAGVGEGVPEVEQAEIATEATMVMAPKPVTVSIALSPAPAMVVRILMDPPHASQQVAALFPLVQAPVPAMGGNTRADPAAARAGQRPIPGKRRRP